MCGRYALGIRASFIRYQLQQQHMQVDEAPEDDEARETYNFPPGAYGLVYRADVPDNGYNVQDGEEGSTEQSFTWQLKVMKWGLIPFWTKRSPDYGSMMRTINCRDDSLLEDRGMWTTMKHKKRCIVVAQGFYEWLKKGPGGKEKVPHFVKRKDGLLMYFAGLWDCVRYEDAEEKLYTYTIITTDANKQLQFLHDRMPVILDPDSEAMRTWLDPTRTKWSKELQSLLVPYQGELECYPVSKEVGKVGNNSPDFIIPVDSKENKNNIANFFGNAKKGNDPRPTKDTDTTENHAPIPVPLKRKLDDEEEYKYPKVAKVQALSPRLDEKATMKTPEKPHSTEKNTPAKKTRSATSNDAVTKKMSPVKSDGSKRITSFFEKK